MACGDGAARHGESTKDQWEYLAQWAGFDTWEDCVQAAEGQTVDDVAPLRATPAQLAAAAVERRKAWESYVSPYQQTHPGNPMANLSDDQTTLFNENKWMLNLDPPKTLIQTIDYIKHIRDVATQHQEECNYDPMGENRKLVEAFHATADNLEAQLHEKLGWKVEDQSMGISTLTGKMDGREVTVFADNTTNVAFGPLMESPEQAEAFLAWMQEAEDWFVHDVRTMSPEKLTNVFRNIFLPSWRRSTG